MPVSAATTGATGAAATTTGSGGSSGGAGSSTPTPTTTAADTPTAVQPTETQDRPLSTEVEPLREVRVGILPDTVPFVHGARVEAFDTEEGNDETLVPSLTIRIRNRTGRERALAADAPGLPLPRRRLRAPNGNAILARREFKPDVGECAGSITPTPEPTPSGSATPTATPAPASGAVRRDIAPGETLTQTYRLFADPDNPGGCFPDGSYRLSQPFVAVTDGTRLRYRWGFTIEVRS
ncbi:MAG: hypothetical protein A07HB70_01328 [uncultured archaeon A07HB70]|nr:MAG: hypothetical protein A07HB70_01328 [uncultured archaeon A07HB70]